MLESGIYVDESGEEHADVKCDIDSVISNFKGSGLSLSAFLAQYNDLSRDMSLWSVCNKVAEFIVKAYKVNGGSTELAKVIQDWVIKNNGECFPDKEIKVDLIVS